MKSTGDELLLAHLQMLARAAPCAPAQARLNERVEPGLAVLLLRALTVRGTAPRGACRL